MFELYCKRTGRCCMRRSVAASSWGRIGMSFGIIYIPRLSISQCHIVCIDSTIIIMSPWLLHCILCYVIALLVWGNEILTLSSVRSFVVILHQSIIHVPISIEKQKQKREEMPYVFAVPSHIDELHDLIGRYCKTGADAITLIERICKTNSVRLNRKNMSPMVNFLDVSLSLCGVCIS